MNDTTVKNNIKYGHYNCLLCGDNNPWSLGLDYKLLDDGRVYTEFKGNKVLQGYKGILHGGVISALLDSAMVHCLFHYNIEAVTAEMTIRFAESVPFDAPVQVYGKIIENHKFLFYTESELICNNLVVAKAKAKFMRKTK
ncbi:MAG: PaaI family thioesterase [bacterium]|nr:PaaI family thioesterase [bacterium]